MDKEIRRVVVGALETNCYILKDKKSGAVAIIDPGGQAELIERELSQDIDNVKYILLTHFHIDHIMAVNEIRGKTGAQVAIFSLDAEGYADPGKNGSVWLFGRAVAPDKADILLNDGDVLPLGELEIKVVHTPGHTPGGCCYICGDIIFSGDTLFRESIGRVDFPGGDMGQMKASLRRLADLEGDFRVLPGHREETTLGFERENNPYLREIL